MMTAAILKRVLDQDAAAGLSAHDLLIAWTCMALNSEDVCIVKFFVLYVVLVRALVAIIILSLMPLEPFSR